MPNFVYRNGKWQGAYTEDHYPGAYANGSRIKKVWGEEGDLTPVGAEGTVIGSIGREDFPEMDVVYFTAGRVIDRIEEGDRHRIPQIGYFVEWDNKPGISVFTRDVKISKIEE